MRAAFHLIYSPTVFIQFFLEKNPQKLLNMLRKESTVFMFLRVKFYNE
jgi:hypothetical protein